MSTVIRLGCMARRVQLIQGNKMLIKVLQANIIYVIGDWWQPA